MDIVDYYNTASAFLKLGFMAKCLIGEHFKVITAYEYLIDTEKGDQIIFLAIFKKKEYPNFKRLVKDYVNVAASTPKLH